MIDTATLIKSVFQAARAGSSGYQDEDEVNRNIKQVEIELMSTLLPLYSTNFNIQTLLSQFIETKEQEPLVNGKLDYPSDFYEYNSASTINGIPVYPKNKNEIGLVITSPTRKPKEDGPCYSTIEGDGIQYYPETLSEINVSYFRKPIFGEIKFTEVSTSSSDYVDITTEKSMEWPEKAINILYYLLLEKYGVDQRESLALEYSQLGINKEVSKL